MTHIKYLILQNGNFDSKIAFSRLTSAIIRVLFLRNAVQVAYRSHKSLQNQFRNANIQMK